MTPGVRTLLAGVAMATGAGAASASYRELIVFGDSLSDNGNLHALIGYPGAPYPNGRFSNGEVAVEVMARQLGLSLRDYAYGGAQTGQGNMMGGNALLDTTGLIDQVDRYAGEFGGAGDPQALYVVWAGPNDFFTGLHMFDNAAPIVAANNLLSQLERLYDMGAQSFFVPLMPDLGVTPAAISSNAVISIYTERATYQTQRYNELLLEGFASLKSRLSGITIHTFDTAGYMSTAMQQLAEEGKNIADACVNANTLAVCTDPDNHLFWDQVHPTRVGHERLGHAFAASLVPEPSSYVLFLTGLAGVAAAAVHRRRTMAAPSPRHAG